MLSNEDILFFSNPQLDRKIGGIPIPSLTLIEGANDSGKTIVTQQIAFGAVKSNKRVLYISTDNDQKKILEDMGNLNWDIKMQFILGDIKILFIDAFNVLLDKEKSRYYLLTLINYIKNKSFENQVIIIDAITYFLKNAETSDILNFFSTCKNIIDSNNINFIINIHPYAIESEVFRRVSEICDGHIKLEKRTFRDKSALTLSVMKMNGAILTTSNMISFEVSNTQGIKVLPFTSTKG